MRLVPGGLYFWGIVMILMALQMWDVIHILPNHPHDHGNGEEHAEHGCECHDHHHHHEEEHHHPVHCEEGDGKCHCGPKVSKKGYFGGFRGWDDQRCGGFSLFHTGDDRAACHGSSVGKRSVGDVPSAMFAVGHSILLVAAGTSYSVVERWMYDPKYENQQNPPRRDGHCDSADRYRDDSTGILWRMISKENQP